MRSIFFLLDWIAQPLYILLAVLVAWYFYQFLQARSEMIASYFELERDLSRRRQANAITMIVIALEVAVLLLGVQVRAVPFLETERDLDMITAEQLDEIEDTVHSSDTPSAITNNALNVQVGTPLGDNPDIIVLTPTPTPTPVGTIVPNAPPSEGCETSQSFLEVPANGQRVLSPIIVRGTAFADNFVSAKIELSGPGTNGQFIVVSNVDSPVTELSDFSQFLPAPYEEGLYEFRLMVFDISANLVASCLVNIYISDPPAAATPTPGG